MIVQSVAGLSYSLGMGTHSPVVAKLNKHTAGKRITFNMKLISYIADKTLLTTNIYLLLQPFFKTVV